MVDQQLSSISTDIDPKGPAAPLGSKNVVPHKGGTATKSIVSFTEKISHKNGDTNKKQVSQNTMKSASKAKKAKVAMMKKFVTKIGTPENNKILMK